MKTAPARSSLADAERKLRSRIAQLVHGRWLLHGTVAPRQRVCGKPNCRCAQGQLHASLYLVRSRREKVQQLFVAQLGATRAPDRLSTARAAARRGLRARVEAAPRPPGGVTFFDV